MWLEPEDGVNDATVVVTGASRGIGAAVTRRLAGSPTAGRPADTDGFIGNTGGKHDNGY